MLRFSLFCKLMEDLKGTGSGSVFKNPSKAEMKKIPPFVRGIVSDKGNLFVSSTNRGTPALHLQIINRVNALFPGEVPEREIFGPIPKSIVTVQRIEDTNLFVAGESETGAVLKKQFVKDAKKNVPHIKFNLRARAADFQSFKDFSIFGEEFSAKLGKTQGTWKNPTKDEMKKIPRFARGWLTKDGDLYVGEKGIHVAIVRNIRGNFKDGPAPPTKQFNVDPSHKFGITLMRVERQDVFAIGESEPIRFAKDRDKQLALIRSHMKAGKQVNPHIKFVATSIIDISDVPFGIGIHASDF